MSLSVVRIVLTSEQDDPLDSVRRTVDLCDAMIAEGATVGITGELAVNIRFDVKPEPDTDEKEVTA